MNQWRDFS